MINKRAVLGVACSAAAFVMLSGFGHCGGDHGGPKDQARMARFAKEKVDDMMDDLDAKDDQRVRAQAIADRLIKDAQGLIPQHQRMKQELIAEWNTPKPDAPKIHTLIDEHIDNFRRFAHEAADGLIEFHQILTPDQRAKVNEQLQKHNAH
jgi:Spy/CpxP family protein refolding chaperone